MRATIFVTALMFIHLGTFMSPSFVAAQSGSRGDAGAAAAYNAYLQQLAYQRQQAALQQEAARRQQEAARLAAQQQRSGIVVVELFTSQGCNSCPPADAALKQIVDVAAQSNLKVYALSFHVDYWNRLGWEDPYSHKDYSTRQAAYAAKTDNNVYTPQMIVNGTAGFLGSDKKKAHEAITGALAKSPKSTVDLRIGKSSSPGTLAVDYRIGGSVRENALNVAVVQTPLPNEVSTGENAGRKLSHVNVVRAFKVIVPEGSTGTVELELPDDFDDSLPYEVVGYVQDKTSYSIVGANAIPAGGASVATNTR